ncbi:MAG: hypothetical protein O2807_10405 [bacterium]|nr:hypothetical protein [bacterium]
MKLHKGVFIDELAAAGHWPKEGFAFVHGADLPVDELFTFPEGEPQANIDAIRALAEAHDPVPPAVWAAAQEEKAALDDLANNKTLTAAVEVFVERLNGLGDAITQAEFAALYVTKRKAGA